MGVEDSKKKGRCSNLCVWTAAQRCIVPSVCLLGETTCLSEMSILAGLCAYHHSQKQGEKRESEMQIFWCDLVTLIHQGCERLHTGQLTIGKSLYVGIPRRTFSNQKLSSTVCFPAPSMFTPAFSSEGSRAPQKLFRNIPRSVPSCHLIMSSVRSSVRYKEKGKSKRKEMQQWVLNGMNGGTNV